MVTEKKNIVFFSIVIAITSLLGNLRNFASHIYTCKKKLWNESFLDVKIERTTSL